MWRNLFLSIFIFLQSPLCLASVISPGDVLRYAKILEFHDPHLLLAVARVESDLQPLVDSTAKGVKHYGLMQISYETAKNMGFRGKPTQLYDWKTNLEYGAKFLSVLMLRYNYRTEAVLAAYNAGTAFPCRVSGCRGFVNQGYVDKVLGKYERPTASDTAACPGKAA